VLLERSLTFTFVVHGLGMVAMALFLLPGMPGGGTVDDAARVAYIAAHPWLWRLGWLPWQLTAASDLLLSFALLRTAWVPRIASVITLVVTIAAVIPDQYGQVAWITKGIALAESGDKGAYLAYEKRIFDYTAAWGGSLYTLGALGWTWCFAAGGAWNRRATVLSAILWPLFGLATLGPLFGLDAKVVAASNAVGFVLLQIWFVLVADLVYRRRRAEGGPGPIDLYEQVLADKWITLPAALRAMHLPDKTRGVLAMR